MFDLPELAVEDIDRFADWVELCALAQGDGSVSFADAADVLQDASLGGNLRGDLYAGDVSLLDDDTFSPDDATERFVEMVWQALTQRALAQGKGYPFTIANDRIERLSAWQDVPAFTMLLIMDLSRAYTGIDAIVEPNTVSARLFEKVVEASLQGLAGGQSVRFGDPIEPGWPTKIDDRIRKLGELLGLSVERLKGKTRPRDKDRGLDVVGRLSFGDNGPATLFFLTQCATGKNWKKKRGEPSIKDWSDIFVWNGTLLKTVAVPWRLDTSDFNYVRVHRHFDSAVVLDRPRLIAGDPDAKLEVEIRKKMTTWCRKQIKKFPKLR
jgi:hypothetical protein